MTFGTMKTKVSKLIHDPSNTAISEEDVGVAINDALRYWKHKRFWFNEAVDTSVTFTASTAAIGDMPSDILYPLERGGIVLNYQNMRYELQKIRPEEYDAMNNETEGRPLYYTYRTAAYEVYPYPDQAYTGVVRYIQDYSDLSASSDTNDFTTNAEALLVFDAASRLQAELNQDRKMEAYFTARAKNEYNILLSRTNKQNSTGSIAVYG